MEKVKIGLALSEGGARGMCHVGVLKALEENGIKPDMITGSSMGAVIGGAYASGMGIDRLIALTRSVNNHLIRDIHIRRGQLGLFRGRRVEKLFERHLGGKSFEDCPIPFACTAVDLESGKLKVFNSGHLWRAIRASMSIPVAFQPVEIDGNMYIDGGILCRIPLLQIRDMGADVIIAADAMGPLEAMRPKNILEMAVRFYDIFNWEYSRRKLHSADVMLTPEIGCNILDFKRVMPVVEKGYRCALEHMPEIKAAIAAATERKLAEARAAAAESSIDCALL
ncbi:MAG: patatin-like phospholipase family protein [Clostridiales bacterium]|jgi:NTE family protein|nr:patatin-like phospholipase family protein [Clostridiales bacterium]